jgi:hypothetical protein
MNYWKKLVALLLGTDNFGQVPLVLESSQRQTSRPLLDAFDIKSIWKSCNSRNNRNCWSDGFDIHTDYEDKWPEGIVRKVVLTCSICIGTLPTQLTALLVYFGCYKRYCCP